MTGDLLGGAGGGAAFWEVMFAPDGNDLMQGEAPDREIKVLGSPES